MRAALAILLPLFLPLIVFFGWRALGLGRAVPQWFEDVPWLTLLATGVVLSALVLGTWSLVASAPPGAEYRPPKVEDGRIVPGGFDR